MLLLLLLSVPPTRCESEEPGPLRLGGRRWCGRATSPPRPQNAGPPKRCTNARRAKATVQRNGGAFCCCCCCCCCCQISVFMRIHSGTCIEKYYSLPLCGCLGSGTFCNSCSCLLGSCTQPVHDAQRYDTPHSERPYSTWVYSL